MGNEVLRAESVRKQFFRKGRESARHFDAVAGVSVSLHSGELVEVIGRSGSGKKHSKRKKAAVSS